MTPDEARLSRSYEAMLAREWERYVAESNVEDDMEIYEFDGDDVA